jgi:uncharacterized lipoprotein YmbA
VIVAAIALLSGCLRSPATHFFTLVAIPPQQSRPIVAAGSVQVVAVHIPDILDRPQRVIEGSTGRLEVLEQEQWGAPLAEMIRRVLSEDLAARLPPGMVLTPNAPISRSTRRIVIDIQEFQPDLRGRVLLDTSWIVLGREPSARTERATSRFTLQAGKDADSQVQTMSELLSRLSDAIVASLVTPASHTKVQPKHGSATNRPLHPRSH